MTCSDYAGPSPLNSLGFLYSLMSFSVRVIPGDGAFMKHERLGGCLKSPSVRLCGGVTYEIPCSVLTHKDIIRDGSCVGKQDLQYLHCSSERKYTSYIMKDVN